MVPQKKPQPIENLSKLKYQANGVLLKDFVEKLEKFISLYSNSYNSDLSFLFTTRFSSCIYAVDGVNVLISSPVSSSS